MSSGAVRRAGDWRTARRLASPVALALVALGAVAWSGGASLGGTHSAGAAERAAGAKVFSAAGCRGCHTLEAAGAAGRAGPNLDQLKPSAELVIRQVTGGGNGMPAFAQTLTRRQIEAVAAYVASGAATAPSLPQSFGSIAAAFAPDGTTVAGCRADAACYEQAFGNVAYFRGPEAALDELARAMQRNSAVAVDCHPIAHAIGAGAYLRYRDAGRSFVAAGRLAMTCSSGYYHGVLQRALRGVQPGALPAAAHRLCGGKAATQNPFVRSQCLHGLGHGLMIYTGYELPQALRICDDFGTHFARVSCAGGVFMENVQSSLQIRSRWLRAGDPRFPCDAVARRDKGPCYLLVTSHLLAVDGGNWEKTAAWCRRADAGFVATCFQSFGRDAVARSLENPKRVLQLCALAGARERECIYGAARDYANSDANATRATPFCELAPRTSRRYCFSGVGALIGGLYRDAVHRAATCRVQVPWSYWRDCYGGARVPAANRMAAPAAPASAPLSELTGMTRAATPAQRAWARDLNDRFLAAVQRVAVPMHTGPPPPPPPPSPPPEPPPGPPPVTDVDLALNLTASPAVFVSGDTVTFMLAVTNLGGTTGTGVTATNTLPPGMSFVSVASSQGACAGGQTIMCDLGNLGNGSTATISVVARATTAASQTDVASAHGNENDPATGNNAASVTIAGAVPPPAPPPPPPPPPPPGVTGQAKGTVLVDGTAYTAGPIAFGSTVDVKPGGGVQIVAGTASVFVFPPAGAETSFVVSRGARGVVFRLAGGTFGPCAARGPGSRTAVRGLWAKAKGTFEVRGRYSSGTSAGYWLTLDRCDGTLTSVKKGSVQVADLLLGRRVAVPVRKSYLASPTKR